MLHIPLYACSYKRDLFHKHFMSVNYSCSKICYTLHFMLAHKCRDQFFKHFMSVNYSSNKICLTLHCMLAHTSRELFHKHFMSVNYSSNKICYTLNCMLFHTSSGRFHKHFYECKLQLQQNMLYHPLHACSHAFFKMCQLT
jgi:hypothetical protein